MRSRTIIFVFLGLALSSLLVLTIFVFVTFYLAEKYIDVTVNLVHHDRATNQALLHVFVQSCVLGAAGGALFVLQILISLAHSDENWFSPVRTEAECGLVAFLIPFKGIIAGAMASGVVGGIFFAVGGPGGLAHGHLLILGVSCIAGYSEHALQRLVRYGESHTDHV